MDAAGGGLRALRRIAAASAPPSAQSLLPALRQPSTAPPPSLALPQDRAHLGASTASALGVDGEGALLDVLFGSGGSSGAGVGGSYGAPLSGDPSDASGSGGDQQAVGAAAALCASLLASAERGDFARAQGALASATPALARGIVSARLGGAQFSLLHYAAAAGQGALVRALLAAGADARAASSPPARLTPLHSAAAAAASTVAPSSASGASSSADDEARGIIAALAAAGADVNAVDGEFAQAPLHLAAARGAAGAVEALLAAGARADARDRFGDTPAELAEDAGFAHLAQRLKGAEGAAPEH